MRLMTYRLNAESDRVRMSHTHSSSSTWMRHCVVGLMLLGSAQAVCSQSTNDPMASRNVMEWLTRMHEASRHRAYTGTLVVSSASSLSASRIWHVCDGTQQMERVETLTGAPRSTIRHNSDVITFVPDDKIAWVDKRDSLGVFPELMQAPVSTLPDFYGVKEGGVERVADYVADVVDILPKDKLRFGYRIWSEKKTGLIVKLQTLGEQGAVLEQVAFTELQLGAPVRMEKLKRLMKDTKGYEVQRQSLRKTTADAEGWKLKETVPGFQSVSCHSKDTGATQTAGSAPMQWVFSDGLASVSLFVEPYDAKVHLTEGQAVTGATHSLTRRMGPHWITALGEVPASTLRRFASALERTR